MRLKRLNIYCCYDISLTTVNQQPCFTLSEAEVHHLMTYIRLIFSTGSHCRLKLRHHKCPVCSTNVLLHKYHSSLLSQ